MRTAWIPEAPEHRGVYANESDHTCARGGQLQPSTTNAQKAKQFESREACQDWCDANPIPKFSPEEHGFE